MTINNIVYLRRKHIRRQTEWTLPSSLNSALEQNGQHLASAVLFQWKQSSGKTQVEGHLNYLFIKF